MKRFVSPYPPEGIGLMVLSSTLFAFMGALVKLSSQRLPFWEVAFFRSAVSVVVIAAVMLAMGKSFETHNRRVLVSRGLFGWLALVSYFFALSRIPLADAVLLGSTSPLWTTLLAVPFLGERLSPWALGCLAIAGIGTYFVLGPSGDMLSLGGLVALAAGVFAAGAMISLKRAGYSNSSYVIVLWFMGIATVLTLPFLIPVYQAPQPQEWALLLGVGVTGAAGQLAMTEGYHRLPASTASILTLLTPAISTVIGMALLDEMPSIYVWIGGALILLGAGLLTARRPAPPPTDGHA